MPTPTPTPAPSPSPSAAQLRHTLERARQHESALVDVVIVSMIPVCPRCGSQRQRTLDSHQGDSTYPYATRCCRACATTFRVVAVPGPELGRALLELPDRAPPAPAECEPDEQPPEEPCAKSAADQERDEREAADANEVVPEDLEEAVAVLEGWKLRRATIRTRRLMDDDLPPEEGDLELLELAWTQHRAKLGEDSAARRRVRMAKARDANRQGLVGSR